MNQGYLLAFFDLPTKEKAYGRKYRRLVKGLEAEGFVRIQKSIYCRTKSGHDETEKIGKRIKDFFGDEFGDVVVVSIGKKEFENMYVVSGGNINVTDENVFEF